MEEQERPGARLPKAVKTHVVWVKHRKEKKKERERKLWREKSLGFASPILDQISKDRGSVQLGLHSVTVVVPSFTVSPLEDIQAE